MASLAISHSLRCTLRQWPQARPVTWQWSAVVWLTMTIGAFVALLTMLNLLPCIDHCAQGSSVSVSVSTWFFCDLLLQSSPLSESDSPSPHHHHAPPRGSFEPLLAQVGFLSAAVLLIGRLSPSTCPLARGLTSAPPTPPPRTA
jgi:hypothetical protein